MADVKISGLPAATTPLAGTEVLPIVQSSTTKKVSVDNLTVQNVRSNANTGILQIVGPAAGTTRVMTTPDANFTAARTDAGQTFTGAQVFSSTINGASTISVGGATPAASGAGITFPASQSASSDANTLDDYEEGTFQTTVTPSGTGSITLSTSSDLLAYTKIGQMVTVTGRLEVSSYSLPTGSAVYIALPFAVANLAENSSGSATAIFYYNGATTSFQSALVNKTDTVLTVFLPVASMGAGSVYQIGISYFTS